MSGAIKAIEKLKKGLSDDPKVKDMLRIANEEFTTTSAASLVEKGGKYLKYSDLLLRKGQLMAKGRDTKTLDKEIDKEMKKLGIQDERKMDEYI